MTQRTVRFVILATLLAGIGGGIALLKVYTTQKSLIVNNYGVVTTGPSRDNKVTINEYSFEAEHRMKLKLMAGAMHRQCDAFIRNVQSVTVDAPPNWLNSDILSDASYGSQQSHILEPEVAAVLKSQQEQAKTSLERVFEAQAAFRVANGPMLYLTATEQRNARVKQDEAIRSFGALKQDLMKHTQMYCERIRGLT